ncbi:MAG TPA: AarF/ABC1/UbiB kinase family protein [Calditrichia bacterium]|nr:AarF/ABC1/UbiB kinase family protein [Calditrichota bacterium]HQU72231.1 AarF/ABC1/UbiB kinase family protein [Calditrichia bacterium]HQV31940.1 AarF/ABC1/UbiB kinase family protein [Calditrichia bacterium]
MSDDFPSSKFERGKLVAKAGLKAGKNYAKYYVKKSLGGEESGDLEKLHAQNASDIYQELSKLRGTALKLAQSLSMDTGVLPEQFAEVMANAQYSVPPMNRALVRQRIKQELGAYPEQLFKRFKGEAIAAASLGQVHEAELRDGRKVAVKIQYPNVRETIRSDMAMAKTIFKRLISGRNIDDYFAEIYDKLLEETDYLLEGKQIEYFAGLYQTHPGIVTPRLVPELSTARVLTMTFVEGLHLEPFLKTGPAPAQRNTYGQILWDFFHEQICNEQYTIHADVHPGNFLFREDGRVGIVDFGCVKTFPEQFLNSFIQMIPAHLEEDQARILQLYYDTDILDREAIGSQRNALFADFFQQFGKTILAPYLAGRFDFGEPAFREALNAHFRKATTFTEIRGSRHYIFVNKVVIGLYSLLMQLGAVVETAHSRVILEEAIGKFNARASEG